MAANNWGRESAKLLSRIQLQRKADKFNRYRGLNMNKQEKVYEVLTSGRALARALGVSGLTVRKAKARIKQEQECCGDMLDGESVSDDNWFRNGGLPPIGESVVVFADSCYLLYGHDVIGKTGTVAATYTSDNGIPVVVVEYNSSGYCFDLNCVYPEGFDIEDLHHQVLTIMHIDDALKGSDIEHLGQTIGIALTKSGCRHHPELAE